MGIEDERGLFRKEDSWSPAEESEEALPGRWGWGRCCSAENPPSRSMKKTWKNKQKPCGNGDGGNTSEALQPPWKKRAQLKVRRHLRVEQKIKIPEELKSRLVEDSVQFSSVAQSCPTLCDPMNRSTPDLPVHHQLPEFTQTHIHRVSDAIQPSHPLSSPSPPAPNPSQHQTLFQWVNSSHEVAKALEFQL